MFLGSTFLESTKDNSQNAAAAVLTTSVASNIKGTSIATAAQVASKPATGKPNRRGAAVVTQEQTQHYQPGILIFVIR